MSTSLQKTYAALVAEFPLNPLRDEADYDKALNIAALLVGRTDLTTAQDDDLEVLADIIQKYEALHCPI